MKNRFQVLLEQRFLKRAVFNSQKADSRILGIEVHILQSSATLWLQGLEGQPCFQRLSSFNLWRGVMTSRCTRQPCHYGFFKRPLPTKLTPRSRLKILTRVFLFPSHQGQVGRSLVFSKSFSWSPQKPLALDLVAGAAPDCIPDRPST